MQKTNFNLAFHIRPSNWLEKLYDYDYSRYLEIEAIEHGWDYEGDENNTRSLDDSKELFGWKTSLVKQPLRSCTAADLENFEHVASGEGQYVKQTWPYWTCLENPGNYNLQSNWE